VIAIVNLNARSSPLARVTNPKKRWCFSGWRDRNVHAIFLRHEIIL
jgi:hypothetical protein